MSTTNAALTLSRDLKPFISRQQRAIVHECLEGEESEHFQGIIESLRATIAGMPVTYETDGQGKSAMAHLHYFMGSMDWHITERDIDSDGEGQIQAFGLANLGHGAELGYVSIAEIIKHGAELDFYWTPKPLSEIAN